MLSFTTSLDFQVSNLFSRSSSNQQNIDKKHQRIFNFNNNTFSVMEAEFTWDSAHMVRLLKQTYSGSNSQLQKVAEKQLKAIEGHPNFAPAIKEIILNNSIDTNARSSAALCLSRVCKNDDNKIPQNMLMILFELMDAEISIHLKRQVSTGIKLLLSKESHQTQREQLITMICEKIRQFAQTADVRLTIYEALVIISNILVSIPPTTELQIQQRCTLIPLSIDFSLKFMIYFTESLKVEQSSDTLLRKLWISRQIALLIKAIIKSTNPQQKLHDLNILCYPNLDVVLMHIILLKVRGDDFDLFSLGQDKQSNTLNECKLTVLTAIDFLVKRIDRTAKKTSKNIAESCATMVNLPTYLKTILTNIILYLKKEKYYDMEEKAVELLDCALKLVKTTLKQPNLDSFFGGCRQELVIDIILPLLELGPSEIANYDDEPQDLVNYIMGIANRQTPSGDDDDVWAMQVTVAELLTSFCEYQHGMLIQLFKFAFGNLLASNYVQTQKLLLAICILRDKTKQRPQIHQALKAYLDAQLPNLLQPMSGNHRIIRTLQLYTIHKYTLYISNIDPGFLSVSGNLAVQVIQSQSLRSDEALQIVALEILTNMCDIGEIIMQNTALPTFQMLVSLINKAVNHKLLDAIQELISTYGDSLTDEVILQCVHELVIKVDKDTETNQPPVASNKCWNIIRAIGSKDKFIPKLIEPIEAEIFKLQKYLKEPEKIDFEEDFLLLCTCFISKSKTVTPSQLNLFESFWKIFEKYGYTFGHMFETLSYFIVYGANILKSAPKAIDYLIQICIKSITLPDTPKAGQPDQCQGVFLLQSLIICCADAFSVDKLWPIVQTLRQRLQLPIKFNFLKANLLCALALALVKIWRSINSTQSQLLLTMILSDTSCFQSKQANKLFILILCELLGLNDEVVLAKLSTILRCCIGLFQQLYVQSTEKKTVLLDPTEDAAYHEYDIALETYLSPVKDVNELERFKQTWEVLKKDHQEQLMFAVNQLPKQQQQQLVNMLRTTKVGDDARVKLTVRKNINN